MKKLVLIPIYNEEEYICPVITEIRHYYHDDILVVNDGSTDDSAGVLKKVTDITTIDHPENQGYGQSLITGFGYAAEHGYDLLVTIDCDKQHEPYHIPHIFSHMEDNPELDVYSASRYLEEMENSDEPPADRKRINGIITGQINRVTGYKLTDGFCGMKGYRVKPLAALDLREQGYAFPIEFWLQARHNGLKVEEFPIERVYKNHDRTFGSGLDDSNRRLKHYEDVLRREAKRWHISLPWELTRTT